MILDRPTKIFDKDDFNDCEFLGNTIVFGLYGFTISQIILMSTDLFRIDLFLESLGIMGILIWILLLIRFIYRLQQYKNELITQIQRDQQRRHRHRLNQEFLDDLDIIPDRNQWFDDFDHVISDKPLIIDYDKIYSITKEQAITDPIARELLDKWADYQLKIKQVVRKIRSRKKHLYWSLTWQYQYGEAMRKWLHNTIGASQVKIEYNNSFEPQVAKFTYRNNQYLFLYHEDLPDEYLPDEYLPHTIHRFHLFSTSPDFTCDVRFDDITLTFRYLDGSRSFFGTDEVKSGIYPIFLGDGKPNRGFKNI